MRTATVITAVDTVAPRCSRLRLFKRCVKKIVPMDARAIFTILFPMRIVERRRSYLSSSFSASFAFLLPFSARVLSLVLLKEENAVSVAEKYPDKITSAAIMATYKGTFMVFCFTPIFIKIYYFTWFWSKRKRKKAHLSSIKRRGVPPIYIRL